jgi:AcrR family transcriptional regulator
MPAGRPRAFDVDKALDRALRVFWKKGYEGASLPDLTHAMRITRPSMYAAFGNKEALFRKAIDRYATGPAGRVADALQEPHIRTCIERWFDGMLDLVMSGRNPRGCFMVQSILTCGDEADELRREMIKRRSAGEPMWRARFERAIAEGELPNGTRAGDLAKYLLVVTHGLAVHAASGATREQLERVAKLAINAFPR